MEQELDGTYVCYVALGETRVEFFQLRIGDVLDEESDYKALYPGIKNADSDAEVFGPDSENIDRRWMINGFADQKSISTIYKICFQHGDGRTRRARVWWLPVEESEDAETVLGTSYKHTYYLRSRFAE